MPYMVVPFGESGSAIVHYRGSRAKTWKCECGKRTPNKFNVCQHCGLYAEGCPKCDADVLPAKDTSGEDLHKFMPGVKRLHKCSKEGCDFAVYA